MRRPAQRHAMTLIEVAIALAVLTVGLTAVTATYITALRWAREARDQYTGMAVARQALHHPRCIEDQRQGGSSVGLARDAAGAGWSNGYYVLRRVGEIDSLDHDAGYTRTVTVEVYAGGTNDDGELIATVAADLLFKGAP